jgi:hypothetical protein
METEMELTLEELNRIEERAREWGGAFHLSDDEEKRIIAAARAHLEGQGYRNGIEAAAKMAETQVADGFAEYTYARPMTGYEAAAAIRAIPQPPQQREDDGTGVFHTDPLPSDAALFPITPAPSSTVEPPLDKLQRLGQEWDASPDAGLVERLRACRCAVGPNEYEDHELCNETAAALEAKDARLESAEAMLRESDKLAAEAQAEMERLREALEKITDYRYEPAAEIARAALKP